MQQNNNRGSEQQSSEDLTAPMERTSAGRWAVPPASKLRPPPSPRPVSQDVGPPAAVEPEPMTGPAGSPSAGDNGRWVPDPTVQLTRRGLDSPPVPESQDSAGWAAHRTPADTYGYNDNGYNDNGYNDNGYNDPTGFVGQNGHADSNGLDTPTNYDGANGYNEPNGHEHGWADSPMAPPQPYDMPGDSGPRTDGQDFFDQPGFDDGGLTNGYQQPDPTGATGAFDVVDGLGNPADHSPFDRPPEHGYHEPTGMNPYASEGGFSDGEFGGSDPIDAIDNAGRNFDEEELETGMAARRNAIEWAVVLVAAVLLALVLRAVLLQAFYIPSPSMEDTLLVDDRVLVNKLSYRLNDISRGDIVVFHRTEAEIAASGPNDPKDVIKRVIATEGERIEIRDNQVLIDEQLLVEPYLDPNVSMADFGPQIVPEGHIFVMGDNRNLSSDSRGETGPVPEERVVGRAFFLFWPLNRLSAL